jgi:hypothetical protein
VFHHALGSFLFNTCIQKETNEHQKSSGKGRYNEKGGRGLTRSERGYGARVGDEYIELPKPPQHAPHSVPCTLDVTDIRREHEHLRIGRGGSDRVAGFDECICGACDDRNGRTRARVLQRRLAPDAARGARDEHDFAAVGPRRVMLFGVDRGVDSIGSVYVVWPVPR